MLSFVLSLFIFYGLSFSSTRDLPDLSASSSLIPLHLQLELSCRDEDCARLRLLTSSSPDPQVILITSNYPSTQCVLGDNSQSNFNGLHVDLLRAIAREIGWIEGTNFVLECVTPSEFTRRIKAHDNVTLAEGNTIISSAKILDGFKFSQPLYNSGFNLLIRRKDPRTIWTFLLPVSLKVGLALIFSTVFIAIFIWFFEEKKWKRPWKEHATDFIEVLYDMYNSFSETNAIELNKFSSRIVQWVFWLVVVIFLSIYQADLTDKLASTYVTKEFKSLEEGIENGRIFGALSSLKPYIDSTVPNLKNLYYYVDDSIEAAITTMLQDLRSEKIDAMIITNSLTEVYGSRFCDIQPLESFIGDFSYGLIFPVDVDPDLYKLISQAIIKLTSTHTTEMIKSHNLRKIDAADCGYPESIGLRELGGLWIILGVSIIIGSAINLLKRFRILKPLQNYYVPYYKYNSQKAEIFEGQLKEAVEFEIKKILETYKEQVKEEIKEFESTILCENGTDEDPKK